MFGGWNMDGSNIVSCIMDWSSAIKSNTSDTASSKIDLLAWITFKSMYITKKSYFSESQNISNITKKYQILWNCFKINSTVHNSSCNSPLLSDFIDVFRWNVRRATLNANVQKESTVFWVQTLLRHLSTARTQLWAACFAMLCCISMTFVAYISR